MSGELSRGSYRERLTAEQRREAESEVFHMLLGRLTSGLRNELANYYRFEAPGEPTKRGYIVDLIEGREAPNG